MKLTKYGRIWLDERMAMVAADHAEGVAVYSASSIGFITDPDAARIRAALDALCGEKEEEEDFVPPEVMENISSIREKLRTERHTLVPSARLAALERLAKQVRITIPELTRAGFLIIAELATQTATEDKESPHA